MTAYYGFNCQCGYEFDLEPSWAERVGVLRCRSCGRLIQTASSQPSPPQNLTNLLPRIDVWPNDWQIQSIGKPVPLLHRWRKSKFIVGERKKRELALSKGDGKQKFTVTFSESYIDEGRHPLVVKSESFANYKDALKFYLNLARKFAPEEIIREIRRHLKSYKP